MSGVVISINTPGGTTTGSEELFRNICAASPRKSPWSPSSTARPPPAATSPRSPPTTSSPAKPRSSARSACCSQYPQICRAARPARRQGRGDEIRARSRPSRAAFKPTPPEARAALQSVVNDTYDWFKGLVRDAAQVQPRGPRHGVGRPRLFTAGRPCPEARRRARRGARRHCLARAREGRCQGPAGSRLEARAATATFSLLTSGGVRCRSLRLRGRRTAAPAGGRRNRTRRNLTVSWRSGTLPSKNEAPSTV